MSLFQVFGRCLSASLLIVCPSVHAALFSKHQKRGLKFTIGFIGGFALITLYYNSFLKNIQFPYTIGVVISLLLSILWGLGTALCVQMRCISLLIVPMYCGKPGRGVLKAVLLTYVIAGPITNMGLNAKEVVRVFACSTQLSYNLSKIKYGLLAEPFRNTLFNLNTEIGEVSDIIRSVRGVTAPIESEVEDTDEIQQSKELNNHVDHLLQSTRRSDVIEKKFLIKSNDINKEIYQKMYSKKIEYRCQDQLCGGFIICRKDFTKIFKDCCSAVPQKIAVSVCSQMKLNNVCNVIEIVGGKNVCDSNRQIDPGVGEGYVYLKNLKNYMSQQFKGKVQYDVTKTYVLLFDIQDAKETGERVKHAFAEKTIIMGYVITVINICLALLALRIVCAARIYHDLYLTSIEYDNIYITDYFREIEQRRRLKKDYTILPLKKMERNKYVDVHSVRLITTVHHKLVTQVLKLILEVVTATTFVMLDRLFYEALDVVRQHAEVEYTEQGIHDFEVKVEGIGVFANVFRRVLQGIDSNTSRRHNVSNERCLPRPSLMPPIFFLKIYGGYFLIMVLLFINGYTSRLKRLICSFFYPFREKQRILHLYNDILKKRMKMQKTLRKKAIQAVRTHYLSGENLLSIRMKFPILLGWLEILPAAKMKCLICEEGQPKKNDKCSLAWHGCNKTECPFVCCPECWEEAGERCLACDPNLAELSDIESLSEEEQLRY